MMSGRDRERDREQRDRRQAASVRTNEYFVPRDGIDREVITADICRYLGNDALVRPGSYENPQTRQVSQGYFINAYRNLTTAMIADLKADSERWEAERRATASSGGRSSNVEYRASTTHQSRQYYGPTEATPSAAPGYAVSSSMGGSQQGVYDNSYSQGPGGYSQPAQTYAQPQYAVQDNYYVAGGDFSVDSGRPRVQPVNQQPATVPRASNVQYSSTPTHSLPDSRNPYYSSPQPGPPVSGAQYAQLAQPTDTYYGRAQAYDNNQDVYNDRPSYQDQGAFNQGSVSTASSSTVTSGTSHNRRDRDREERDRHHRSGGRR